MKLLFKKFSFLFFSIATFVLLLGLPLTSRGGLFVLDFVPIRFTEWMPWYSQTLQWHIIDVLKYVFGGEATSKIYFSIVFLFGIFTGYTLGTQIYHILGKEKFSLLFFQINTTLFLILNPWTYERLITQPGIAIGMFSVALTISYLLEQIFTPKRQSLVKSSIFAGLSFLFFPHASVMLLLIGIITILFYKEHIPKKYFLIAPLIILSFNINWLIGDIFYQSRFGATQSIQSFDWANIQGFQGNNLGISTELTHLLLFGFWGEKYHILTPKNFNAYWYIFGFLGFFCVLYGGKILLQRNKRLFFYFFSLGFISYILALGIASKFVAPFNSFLYQHLPGYIGMREPEKWLGITMITYSIFFVVAWDNIIKRIKILPQWTIYLLIFSLLNTWNPMNFWSYQGQLYGIHFPDEYSEVRGILQSIPHAKKTLILPWHTYMACTWTYGKVISSSQKEVFFPLSTVVADNLEISTKYSNSSSSLSDDVENFLKTHKLSFLKKNGISHIILQKGCADKSNYTFLNNTTGIKNIFNKPDSSIYEIFSPSYEK